MSIKILLSVAIATIITLIAFQSYQLGINELKSFEAFKGAYGKVYSAEEENFRRYIFLKNRERIIEHNNRADATYTK